MWSPSSPAAFRHGLGTVGNIGISLVAALRHGLGTAGLDARIVTGLATTLCHGLGTAGSFGAASLVSAASIGSGMVVAGVGTDRRVSLCPSRGTPSSFWNVGLGATTASSSTTDLGSRAAGGLRCGRRRLLGTHGRGPGEPMVDAIEASGIAAGAPGSVSGDLGLCAFGTFAAARLSA